MPEEDPPIPPEDDEIIPKPRRRPYLIDLNDTKIAEEDEELLLIVQKMIRSF